MLLAIDIGNTHTVIGVYAGDSARDVANRHQSEGGGRRAAHRLLHAVFPREPRIFPRCAPRRSPRWCPTDQGLMQAIKDATGARSLVCNAETAEGLFDADYPNPARSGRSGGRCGGGPGDPYGAPVIVVDFGTATNIEVIDRDGRFPRRRYRAGRVDRPICAVHSRRSAAGHRAGGAAGGHRHQHGGGHPIGYHVGRGRPGGRAGAPHLRPAGLSGQRSSPRAVWRRSSSATEYHRRGEHRA